jgi:2-methylaconitate cis-trans-isomerase PrpF
VVRIFNTNTRKIIRSTFPLEDGRAATDGDLAIPGVAGTGAPVRLDFLAPGGATTGKLLPTGNAVDRLDVPGMGAIEVSLVDAANACVFVRARDLGLTGRELPEELDRDPALLERMQVIRRLASIAMGIAKDDADARATAGVPIIGFVAPPMDAPTLSGEPVGAAQVDLTARFLSNGQPHRALPLTASLCTAVAARIAGTVVAETLAPGVGSQVRIGMPSGILVVGAEVSRDGSGAWVAQSGAFYRTARRLFDGRIYVPR